MLSDVEAVQSCDTCTSERQASTSFLLKVEPWTLSCDTLFIQIWRQTERFKCATHELDGYDLYIAILELYVAYTTLDRPVALFYLIRNIEVVDLPVAGWTFSSSSWFTRLQQWTKSNVVVNKQVMRPAGDFHWSVIKLHAMLAAVQKLRHAATASQKSFARWMPPTFSSQCSSAPISSTTSSRT